MKALTLPALAALVFINLGITGCDVKKGPAEKAGETIDSTVENADDAVDKAVENTGEAMEDAEDKVPDNTQ